MKNVTFAKDFKFNGSKLTIEYKKEVLYKFEYSTQLDLYNIEHSVSMIQRSFIASEKNKFKEVVNHTIKHLENGVVLTLDSMFNMVNYPKKHEIYFATLVRNSIQLV